jgi:hypothetical protein
MFIWFKLKEMIKHDWIYIYIYVVLGSYLLCTQTILLPKNMTKIRFLVCLHKNIYLVLLQFF